MTTLLSSSSTPNNNDLHDQSSKPITPVAVTMNGSSSTSESSPALLVNHHHFNNNHSNNNGDIPPFPYQRLIPKRETGADVFVQRYPDCDGRGITIAIIDSGVDPGVVGLQWTTTGLPKIADIRDFSGSGDIDTSRITSLQQQQPNSIGANTTNNSADAASNEWYIVGVSEKRLMFPGNWPRPKDINQIHIGVVKLFDLVSPDALREWKVKRKEQTWAPRLSKAHATILESKKVPSPHATTPQQQARQKDEADAALETLDWFDRKFNDYGPIFDVLCYEDAAGVWRAAVDISHTGDLSQTVLLTNYRDEHKHGTIGGIYQLNYVINILCNGHKLEVVVPQSHGTHVASIAAACFPEHADRNGIAPGAQIVSLKIGHSLLDGSFETGYSLVRAIDYCCKNKILLANVSYGEPYSWADGGCVHEAVERAVRDFGLIMCVAAGNEGPCLNTILSMPANLWTFAVAAYVTPEMGKVLYGLSHTTEPKPYNWTSRAPSLEHGNPVLCCAPGAAQAAVPTYYLMRSELMNGTSMASPNACGNIALVLSACLARNLQWSPSSVRRAIMNTSHFDARYMERLACGNGLIKPCDAFEWLQKYSNEPEWDVEFQCSMGKYRGIYLRYRPALIDQVYTMNVTSLFSRNHEANQHQFELPCRLECDEATWLTIPEQMTLTSGLRPFKIELYASRLRSPGIHYAEIRAYDARNYFKGVLFKVPVTVVLPHFRHTDWDVEIRKVSHRPGIPVRHFFDIPHGATYADISIKLCGCDEDHSGPADASATVNFEFGIMQTIDKLHFQSAYTSERLSLGIGRIVRYQVAVNERLSFMELATVMFWSRMYHASIDIDVQFHGMSPLSDVISFNEGDRYFRLDVLTGARMENIAPAALLSYLNMPTKPFESHIEAILEEPDVAPDGSPMYALNLHYKFSLSKSNNSVLIICPLLMDYLYENEFHSQLWKVFDARKVRVAMGDAKIARRYDYAVKLDKGDYTVIMQVRHRSRARLTKLDELPIYVRLKLTTPIQLELYGSYLDALREDAARKITTKALMPHTTFSCFVSHLPNDKLPKQLHHGNYLEGQLHLMKEFANAPNNAGKKVTCLPLRYYCYESRKGKGGTAAAATPGPQQTSTTVTSSTASVIGSLPSGSGTNSGAVAPLPPMSLNPNMSEAADSNLQAAAAAVAGTVTASATDAKSDSGTEPSNNISDGGAAERAQEDSILGVMLTVFEKISSCSTTTPTTSSSGNNSNNNVGNINALRQHYEYLQERFIPALKETISDKAPPLLQQQQQDSTTAAAALQREKLSLMLAHSYLASLFSTTRTQFPLSTSVPQFSSLNLRIKSPQHMQEALTVCDQLIASVNQPEVLAHMGSKINTSSASSAATKSSSSSASSSGSPASSPVAQLSESVIELKRLALVDALAYKGLILVSDEYSKQHGENDAEKLLKTIDEIAEMLSKFVDAKDNRLLALNIQLAKLHKQPFKYLKICTQLYDDNATEEVHQAMLDMLASSACGGDGGGGGGEWQFLLDWWRDAKAATFSPSCEPF